MIEKQVEKVRECPDCGETLRSDCWTAGRKLQQRCEKCGWKGEPRVPETREIKSTKEVMAGQFYGFHYQIFDKYGYYLTISRYYDTKEDATKKMNDDLARDNTQLDLAPCTAILWPNMVTVTGEVFK